MSTVKATIDIAAPVQRVWETVMDPARLGDWVTIHKSVRDVSESPLRKGATMDQSMVVRGVTFRVHWTLVAVDDPHRAEWEGAGPAHSRARIQYVLTDTGEGGTVFEYTNEFHPPGGRLGNVASRVIVGATSEREANNSLSRLKALLEGRRSR
ncbi:MAG: SRPBCC family protein [Solirubrobacteraceae bacterium]